jgi:transposase
MSEFELFVGVDWATATHQICCLDPAGHLVKQWPVPHSGVGLAMLVTELAGFGFSPERVAVAIERPDGAIVEGLLQHGFVVFAVNPKQLDRFRGRHTVAGAKDDRRDALVAADALRTDRAAFRRLTPEDPRLVQVRELSRLHDELDQELTRLTNRLREQLLRFYPELLALCPAANEPWLWQLLTLAPTPAAARRVPGARWRALLTEHRIRRFTAAELQAVVHAPPLPTSAGTLAAVTEHIGFLLPRVRLAHDQLAQCRRRLDRVLEALTTGQAEAGEHRDVTILRSLPGVGRVVAATMLAEASHVLAARDYQTLRAHAGVAPVTRQSGKGRYVIIRRSCNHRLRDAVFHWARNSIRLDERCRAQYTRLRQRHGYARALRGVADRLLGLLIAMLTTGTVYDQSRRHVVPA